MMGIAFGSVEGTTSMQLAWPPLTIGTIIAAGVLIAACLLFALDRIELAPLLLVAAVCAFKL